MYDWGSAIGEAALMSSRITGRDRFMVPRYISPKRLSVLETYTSGPDLEVVSVPQSQETGELDLESIKEMVGDDTAGLYIEQPSYLGFLETQLQEISEIVHDNGALFVVGVNPISLGLIKPPGDYGADIVVGEGHSLGNPMNFGGPLLGIFGCKDDRKFIRQFPGRVSGMTSTVDGDDRGFVIALQTREQHIRREKATSNICTNNTLCAIASAVYLSSLGSKGLKDLAINCASNADYAMKRFNEIDGVRAPVFEGPHFNEFTVSFAEANVSAKELNSELLKRDIFGGKPVHEDFSDLGDVSLWCTTETHTKEEIDHTADFIEEILGGS
jgi:glycine dehydrogenase subunit 1